MRTLVIAMLVLASGCTLLDAPHDATPVVTNANTSASAPSPPRPCASLAISLGRAVLERGDNMSINVTLTNCGDTLLRVDPGGPCGSGRSLDLTMETETDSFVLGDGMPNGTPMSTSQTMFASHGRLCAHPTDGPPPRFLIPPGSSAADSFSWNGTVARTRIHYESTPNGTSFESWPAPERIHPGTVNLSAQYLVENDTWARATANLTIDGPPLRETSLILIHEWDWYNASIGDGVPDRAAPACDEAALKNGTLVLRGERFVDDVSIARAFVNSTTQFRALAPSGGWLASPWSNDATQIGLFPSGDDVYVEAFDAPTRVALGETHTFHISSGPGESVVAVTNVGQVPLRIEPTSCPPTPRT